MSKSFLIEDNEDRFILPSDIIVVNDMWLKDPEH